MAIIFAAILKVVSRLVKCLSVTLETRKILTILYEANMRKLACRKHEKYLLSVRLSFINVRKKHKNNFVLFSGDYMLMIN